MAVLLASHLWYLIAPSVPSAPPFDETYCIYNSKRDRSISIRGYGTVVVFLSASMDAATGQATGTSVVNLIGSPS